MALKEDVQAVIDGILAGQIVETFEKFYADDIVMIENNEEPRVGKAANRQYEEAFVANVEFHSAEVGRVIIDDANQMAAVEWVFEFTPKGFGRIRQKQVAVQTWRDGKVVLENFYYNKG